jgi:hypothetical protein
MLTLPSRLIYVLFFISPCLHQEIVYPGVYKRFELCEGHWKIGVAAVKRGLLVDAYLQRIMDARRPIGERGQKANVKETWCAKAQHGVGLWKEVSSADRRDRLAAARPLIRSRSLRGGVLTEGKLTAWKERAWRQTGRRIEVI